MSSRNFKEYTAWAKMLTDQNSRPTALNNIKSLIELYTPSEAVPVLQRCGISKIVGCLETSDKPQIELTCKVLKTCFEKFEPGDIIKTFPTYFMYMLRHEKECVQDLAVTEVYKALTTNAELMIASQYIDVFVAVAQLVSNKDVDLANKAVLVTSHLPDEAYPKVLDEMKIGLEYSSSSKCNVFEVIVKISLKSDDLFKLSVQHEYIDFMISELHTNDFLYQMNILELLSQLAAKPYGINYLVECGALQKIVNIIEELENDPLKNLLAPGYMKFFGNVAYHYPKEVLEKYPILMESLFTSLESQEQVILLVALDTLGSVGATIEGKMCLAALGSQYTLALEKVCKLIRNSSSVIKVRAIYCLASLIAIEKDCESKMSTVDQRITLMTREWFRGLSKQPESTTLLFEICKNPFPDIKIAGFTLLDSICQHRWGEEMIAGVAGFIEYLLDRPTDFNKQENEAKYDIVKRLSTSSVFDSNIIARLQTYVEQGPFRRETVMQVALEEGD